MRKLFSFLLSQRTDSLVYIFVFNVHKTASLLMLMLGIRPRDFISMLMPIQLNISPVTYCSDKADLSIFTTLVPFSSFSPLAAKAAARAAALAFSLTHPILATLIKKFVLSFFILNLKLLASDISYSLSIKIIAFVLDVVIRR